MKFTDYEFLILLPIVWIAWKLLRGQYWATVIALLVGSLYFYGHKGEMRVPLILAYCVVNWWVGLRMVKAARPKTFLTLGVGFNLLVLGFFKYTPMLTVTTFDVAQLCGLSWELPKDFFRDWEIPFGLSFYAFTGIAYMVDVYKRRAESEPSFLRYSLYLSFFPQLMAGPILRPRDFLTDLQQGNLPDRSRDIEEAIYLFGRGLFKKMVLADRIAGAIDPFFSNISHPSTTGVWSLPYIYLYAFQIFFDFSGYTDMARGLGLLFGYRWPENFNLPYIACSVQDFWRRWHMTLSEFLRDYLYIPLGGNRGSELRTCRNLMLTMLLGGLWHGASWSFMLWGGLHGMFLIVNRYWSRVPAITRINKNRSATRAAYRIACWVLTFHAVCLAWCFFRLTKFEQSVTCVEKWFVFDPDAFLKSGVGDVSLWVMLIGYGVLFGASRLWVKAAAPVKSKSPDLYAGLAWGISVMLILLAIILAPGGDSPAFIYFQF